MDIQQDHAALLPPGDFAKLDKQQREQFHTMQEQMTAFLLQKSNDFQRLFPNLRIEWRFQVEVYDNVQEVPSTVRYSQRVY